MHGPVPLKKQEMLHREVGLQAGGAPSSTERMRNLVSSYTAACEASGPNTRSNLNCLRAPPRGLYTASSPSTPTSVQPGPARAATHKEKCRAFMAGTHRQLPLHAHLRAAWAPHTA